MSADLSGVAFKTDDALKFAFPTETTAKILVFASNGQFYTIDAVEAAGRARPRRAGAALLSTSSRTPTWWRRSRYQGGRKFLVASTSGNGFVVPEDEVLANTRKGKQVLNVKAPDKAAAHRRRSTANWSAAIGENRKMVIFPLDQVPEMARGRGVRLQRYKEGAVRRHHLQGAPTD